MLLKQNSLKIDAHIQQNSYKNLSCISQEIDRNFYKNRQADAQIPMIMPPPTLVTSMHQGKDLEDACNSYQPFGTLSLDFWFPGLMYNQVKDSGLDSKLAWVMAFSQASPSRLTGVIITGLGLKPVDGRKGTKSQHINSHRLSTAECAPSGWVCSQQLLCVSRDPTIMTQSQQESL